MSSGPGYVVRTTWAKASAKSKFDHRVSVYEVCYLYGTTVSLIFVWPSEFVSSHTDKKTLHIPQSPRYCAMLAGVCFV